jgi:hypothetical protein
MKGSATRTTEDVHELGLYSNDCCNQELIFDEGDTFWRCPRCQQLCYWELECKITSEPELAQFVA